MSRAKRGLTVLKKLKTHPHTLIDAYTVLDTQEEFELYGSNGELLTVKAVDVPIHDRTSNGSSMTDEAKFGKSCL